MRRATAVLAIAAGTLIWSSTASAACHKIKVCDFTESPPCHWSCPDLFIGRAGAAYSMTFKRLDPKAASAIVNELSGIGSAQISGSSVTIKELNKSDIPQVLDKLNISRGAVRVPQ
ncbi:hypothetical protein JQ604_16655 [Bradyrhizobium jicamae]|uniref:hypothetical protein n=1 Tax=Bradyrhizobium jicamae TaxID=280332 RepID=UPI001BA76136|nr:hypothetical protein [Bradyrhizobium jicamae]MBR0753818.1 hypothetical protein [Bradyrhizobium jicamae]